MKNAYAISSLSRQMVKVCEQIDSLAMGVQDTEQGNVDVADAYTDMLLDEIEPSPRVNSPLRRSPPKTAMMVSLPLSRNRKRSRQAQNTMKGGGAPWPQS